MSITSRVLLLALTIAMFVSAGHGERRPNPCVAEEARRSSVPSCATLSARASLRAAIADKSAIEPPTPIRAAQIGHPGTPD